MKNQANLILSAIITGLLLFSVQANAQKINSPALEDYFKPGLIKARTGLANKDKYDLTDALVNFHDLRIYDDLYLQPLSPGAERVFSYDSICRYFEEETNVISLAQDAEIARGAAKGDPYAISVTYESIPGKKKVTYKDVSNDSGSLALMIASFSGSGVKISVKNSSGKKLELYYEEHKSIAKGKFFGEDELYTITIENLSKNDEIIAIAIQ